MNLPAFLRTSVFLRRAWWCGLLIWYALPGSAHGQDGNMLANAHPLGVLTNTITRSGLVNNASPTDYYQFVIEGSVRTVTVEVPHGSLSASIYLSLWADPENNGIGEQWLYDTASAGDDGAVSLWLDPGVYYVAVSQYNAAQNTAYQLSLSQTAHPASPGNEDQDLANARWLSFGQPVTDFVGISDGTDFYRFVVSNQVREVSATVPRSSLSASIYLSLIRDLDNNGFGETLMYTSGSSGQDAVVSLWLDPGVYYLAVQQYNTAQNTTYQLSLAQTPRNSPGTDDDDLFTARPLGFNQPVTDFVGINDGIDYYRFVVSNQVREVSAQVPRSSLSASIYLSLIHDVDNNGFGETLLYAAGSAGQDAVVSLWLDPGVYYLAVQQYNTAQNTAYQLSLAQTPRNSWGMEDDDLSTARPLGFNQPVTDFVGVNDGIDYYRFVVSNHVREVSAQVPRSSLNASVYLSLIRDGDENGLGETLAYAAGSGGQDAAVSLWLDPGVYYVAVSQYNNAQNTTYQLSLSQTPQPQSHGNGDNSMADSVDLGFIVSSQLVSDFVGESDGEDFFKFSVVGPPRRISALIARGTVSGNVLLQLLADADNNGVAELLQSVNGGPSADALVEKTLGPGRYYLRVIQNGAFQNTEYQLRLSRTFTNSIPPFIITQPADLVINSGQAATFRVLADGSGALNYQWRLNGTSLPGAATNTLALQGLVTEPGTYQVSVVITNAYGSITSINAVLTVNPADLVLVIDRAVILSWPVTSPATYLLEGALTPSGPWTTVNRPVVQLGNRFEAAVRTIDQFQFYRLHRTN